MKKELDKETKKKYQDTKERWKANNTYLFSVRLQNSTDADLIERLKQAPSRQGELKRLARLGMEHEKSGTPADPDTIPEAYLKAIAPEPDHKTEQYIRLGKEYEKMLAAGWKLTPPHEEKAEEPKAGPALKNDYGFERTASGLPDLRKVKRWNEEEKKEE